MIYSYCAIKDELLHNQAAHSALSQSGPAGVMHAFRMRATWKGAIIAT
jgi:hypothetical protein